MTLNPGLILPDWSHKSVIAGALHSRMIPLRLRREVRDDSEPDGRLIEDRGDYISFMGLYSNCLCASGITLLRYYVIRFFVPSGRFQETIGFNIIL